MQIFIDIYFKKNRILTMKLFNVSLIMILVWIYLFAYLVFQSYSKWASEVLESIIILSPLWLFSIKREGSFYIHSFEKYFKV